MEKTVQEYKQEFIKIYTDCIKPIRNSVDYTSYKPTSLNCNYTLKGRQNNINKCCDYKTYK